ncbi:MAG: hydrogenase formation protein HypD [Desulfatibacillaceae bacterium]
MKHASEFRDKDMARAILDKLRVESKTPLRLMEVCGTHTMSIFRNGIRSLLPETISLLSGPGCPVCVTAQGEIDAFIELARNPEVTVATFGDLMRVPGTDSSLAKERAQGADVRIVYSTMDALALARSHPDRQVIFLGVGFETTAPTVAGAVLAANQAGVENFSVFPAHKLVPPALAGLVGGGRVEVNGFLCPGHVSVIIGEQAYEFLARDHGIPCVVAGFEAVDILSAVLLLVRQVEAGEARVDNAYKRAVRYEGNPRARAVMEQVFTPEDAHWRGIGVIPGSGLALAAEYAGFDAKQRFGVKVAKTREPRGCSCGSILTGLVTPPECPLYKKVCTPEHPVGPCMVSSEGTCAAWFRYAE